MVKNIGLTLVKGKTRPLKIETQALGAYDDLTKLVRQYFNETDKTNETGEAANYRGWIVAYLDYAVLFGQYSLGNMLFYPGKNLEIEYLQSLRVFNNSRELYLWKGQDGLFTGRLRVDGVGEDHEYVEAEQVMSGTRAGMADGNGGWSKVEEERGVEYFLPCKLNSDLRKNPVRIRTRSYIGYLGNGQASYVDARLVDFCGGGI